MTDRPVTLRDAPLVYAPQNEVGVVYLFAHLAKKFQLRVERVQPSFPDCVAYRRVGSSEMLVRIEFEFRSSNFRALGHNANGCDCIVCWEHNWPEAPEHLEIIELKREFGGAFNVWIQPVISDQYRCLDADDELEWALSKRATPGDLLLMYRGAPRAASRMYLSLPVMPQEEGRLEEGGLLQRAYPAFLEFGSPILLDDMRNHRALRRSTFIRYMQGNNLVTGYWHHLYAMILDRNPKLKRVLAR